MLTTIVFILIVTTKSYCYIINPGPSVIATKGEVWPKPWVEKKSDEYYVLQPYLFNFKAPENIGCPRFLTEALSRYWTILAITLGQTQQTQKKNHRKDHGLLDKNCRGYIESLTIHLEKSCPEEEVRPQLVDDESYDLLVSLEETSLTAPTIWGVLRGLETFSQLVYKESAELRINLTSIKDFPRFLHRGLLLDTARHFIPTNIIFQTLDAMAYNKLNVFHWHIVDDESFPYKSITFPELSDQGAYHPATKVYDQSDVKKIVEYARLRGIRVVAEFDTPGHTRSWGVSHPELLARCYKDDIPTGELGALNPIKEATYEFLTKLFTEIASVFPDSYIHIGGDEVNFDCWASNPCIRHYMREHQIDCLVDLQIYYIQRVIAILINLNLNYIVWEEMFSEQAYLPNSTVVQVWKHSNAIATMKSVTFSGKFALYSSCWYLSGSESGSDWQNFYACDPTRFPGTLEQKRLVLGGETCMWSEYINEYNVLTWMWPRASAPAEKLWSAEEVKDVEDAKRRLEEHTCRMNKRGVQAQPPNGPGVCL